MASPIQSCTLLWDSASRLDSSIHPILQEDLQYLHMVDVLGEIVDDRVERTGSCEENTKVNTKYDPGDVDALILSGKVYLDEGLFDYIEGYPAYFKIKVEGDHETFFSESDCDNEYVLASTLRSVNEKHFLLHRVLVELLSMPEYTREGFVYSHSSGVGVEKRIISKTDKGENVAVSVSDEFNLREACRFLIEKMSNVIANDSDEANAVLGDFLEHTMQWFKKHTDTPRKPLTQDTIDKVILVQSSDFVPAYRIKPGLWPRVAEEWKDRLREWPPPDVVTAILAKGCHVIAKSPPHLVDNGVFIGDGQDVFFRLSFSASEVLLAKSMNNVQLTCWRILKAYQKGFLETSPKVLSSYHWKNVMFWMCESKPETFWINDNLQSAVTCSIEMMVTFLDWRTLPLYFCPQMNLLRHYDPVNTEAAKLKLQHIRAEPIEYLCYFLDNPPKAKVCTLDTAEIPVGCKNKLVETGYSSFCEVLKDILEKKDVEKMFRCGSRICNTVLDLAENSTKRSTPKRRETVQKLIGDSRKFVRKVSKPLAEFNTEYEHKTYLQNEGITFVKNIGRRLLSSAVAQSDNDLELD